MRGESDQVGDVRRRANASGDAGRAERTSVDDIRHQVAAVIAQVEELRLMQVQQGMIRTQDDLPPPAYEVE